MNNSLQKDSIIILAWPQTPVSSVGMWYDAVPKLLGLLKNGYYKAGHAAAIIVNHSNGKLHYFDFGRYHMPQKFGRVRDEQSDPQLKLNFKAEISDDNKILNIPKIIKTVNANKECHGKGILYASVLENVSFKTAYEYAKNLQNSDAVDYGPYDINGSNCSRFIASLAKAANPRFGIRFRLSVPLLLTPLPKGNVVICSMVYYSTNGDELKKYKVKLSDAFKNFVFPQIVKFNFFRFKKRNANAEHVYRNIKIHA